jgi:hypothetical protein
VPRFDGFLEAGAHKCLKTLELLSVRLKLRRQLLPGERQEASLPKDMQVLLRFKQRVAFVVAVARQVLDVVYMRLFAW